MCIENKKNHYMYHSMTLYLRIKIEHQNTGNKVLYETEKCDFLKTRKIHGRYTTTAMIGHIVYNSCKYSIDLR